MISFKKFITPKELLSTLFNEQYVAPGINTTLIRIISVLKSWFKEYPEDWYKDSELKIELNQLIQSTHHRDYFLKYLPELPPQSRNHDSSNIDLNCKLNFKETNASTLVETLTSIDKTLYNEIYDHEIYLYSMNPNYESSTLNLTAFMNHYNNTLNWIVDNFSKETDSSIRANTITKLIDSISLANQIQNYSLVMCIYEALAKVKQSYPSSWKTIKENHIKIYKEWKTKFNNFESLRAILKSSDANKPCLPFLKAYVLFIKNIEKNENDYVEIGGKKLINFAKIRKIIDLIRELNQFDPSKYAEKGFTQPLIMKPKHTLRTLHGLIVGELNNRKISGSNPVEKANVIDKNKDLPPNKPEITIISSNFERKDSKDPFVSSASEQLQSEDQRKRIVQEILETEQKYVDYLTILVDYGMVPLRNEKILTESEIRTLFGNVDAILQFHRYLLEDMKVRIGNWTEESCISDVFEKYYQYFRLYFQFVNNFDESDALLKVILRRNSRFVKQQEQILELTRKLDFASLLIMPVQKVPRYILLLKEYQRKTDPTHPDSQLVLETIGIMETISSHINSSKRDSEQRAKAIQLIDGRLVGYPKGSILKPGRELIDEIDIQILTTQGFYRLTAIFWSDVIMLCKPKDGKKKLIYIGSIKPVRSRLSSLTSFDAKILFKDYFKKDIKNPPNWSKHNYILSLTYLGQQFVFSFPSEKELTRFTTLCEDQKKDLRDLKTYIDDTTPQSSESSSLTLLDNSLYYYGGISKEALCKDELWKFDIESGKWNKVETSGEKPDGLMEHTTVMYNDELYLFGGHTSGIFNDKLYKFNPKSRMWKIVQCTGNIPSPRSGHTCVVSDDCMYIIGGIWFEQVMNSVYYNDIYCFKFKTREWTKINLSNTSFIPREKHISELIGDNIIIYGGLTYQNTLLNDLWMFNIKENTLERQLNIHGYIPTPRHSSASTIFNDKMLIYGGASLTTYLNDIYVFDPVTKEWTLCLTPYELYLRKRHQIIFEGNSLYIYGGKILNENVQNPNSMIALNNISTLYWRSTDFLERTYELKKKSASLLKYSIREMDITYHSVKNSFNDNISLSINDTHSNITLNDKIKEGNHGQSYKGFHTESNTPIFVKVIPLQKIKDVSKVSTTLDCLKLLKHNSFVGYYDYKIVNDNDLWIIEEYCEGLTLKEISTILRNSISERQLSIVCAQALEILSHLHRLNLIHGDLSDSSIIITPDGTMKFVKYGLYEFLDISHEDPSISDKVDIFSLGMMAIQMLDNTSTYSNSLSKKYSSELLDFINSCTNKSSIKRPSAMQLFTHPFISRFIENPKQQELLKEIYQTALNYKIKRTSKPSSNERRESTISVKSVSEDDIMKELEFLRSKVDTLTKENQELKTELNQVKERLRQYEYVE